MAKSTSQQAEQAKKIIVNSCPGPLDFEVGGEHIRIPEGRSEGIVSEALREALAPYGDRVEILGAA